MTSGIAISSGSWSDAARRILRERYLWRKDGVIIEDEDGLCARVAHAVAQAEANYPSGRMSVGEATDAFFRLLVERRFMPNSPTLMNAGKDNRQQLSACFVLPVEDSMVGIFDAIKYAAQIHQSGGGTGFGFSRLRPKGARVGTTQGVASGPVSFMKVFDAATEHVKQGGTRRGANMGILRVDHPDILEFIDCKRSGGITNFNISVAVTEAFMTALRTNGEYALHAPHTGEVVGRYRARDVFDRIVGAAWETGDPGLVFVDRANQWTANPVLELGPLESTNPCGEQFLYPFDACNLGSINLNRFVREIDGKPEIDWDALSDTVCKAVRFLDNVIDINPFPLQQITDMVRSNRRIGLGVMGWADLLFLLGIPFDSEEALQVAGRVMEFVTQTGTEESHRLAEERGPFPNFAKSIYASGRPLRNSTITTIAPTGTISIIADCSSGIEPIFALAFQHRVKNPDGSERVLTFVNPYFERVARARGFYSEALEQAVLQRGSVRGLAGVPEDIQRVFATAHEIEPDWHVRMQAAFQKHTHNAVSKTINLPHTATPEDVERAYLLAYDLGCLGITVFRDGCKEAQVLNVGVKQEPRASGPEARETRPATQGEGLGAEIKPRPVLVSGYTRQIRAPEGSINITINSDGDGPFEMFINVGKAGSDLAALAEALGRLISLILRLPSPMSQNERAEVIVKQLRGIGGSRSIGFGSRQIRSLPDAIAQTLDQHLHGDYLLAAGDGLVGHGNGSNGAPAHSDSKVQLTMPLWTGNLCPTCGCNTLAYEEGCKKCYACGYSEC